MEIRVQTTKVRTKRTFAIARGSADVFERVILELEDYGLVGWGEAAPTAYYDQEADEVHSALKAVEVKDPWNLKGTLDANDSLPSSALAALDSALHDLAAKRLGIPVYRLLGFARPEPVTAYTLGIADLESTVHEAKKLYQFPILKVKIGGWKDLDTVRAVAGEAAGTKIWVDANEAFSPDEAPEAMRELVELGADLIEQPVPASAGPEALKNATEAASPVPVVADESAVSAQDVPPLAGCASGVNIKLAKCGGIRRAIEMVHAARAHGMRVMLGCMVETSLGIAAAAQISGLVDFVDLDGSLLLAEDPFSGLDYRDAQILLPDTPGLGVESL